MHLEKGLGQTALHDFVSDEGITERSAYSAQIGGNEGEYADAAISTDLTQEDRRNLSQNADLKGKRQVALPDH